MSTEVELLKQIADDVATIKNKVAKLEMSIDEIDADLHEVKPAYIKKLKQIEKEGIISQAEFEKKFGVRI